jgi:hypothetical protein
MLSLNFSLGALPNWDHLRYPNSWCHPAPVRDRMDDESDAERDAWRKGYDSFVLYDGPLVQQENPPGERTLQSASICAPVRRIAGKLA